LTAVWAAIHVVRSLLTLDEAHLGEVEDDHVVELLGQLKNAAKDVHLVTKCNCRMATSTEGAQASLLDLNLPPRVGGAVKLPQVIQLAVVVVLTTEDVQLVVVATRGH